MSDFLEFLWAVINSWAGYATGGLVVASAWIFFVWKDKPMPRTIGFVLASLFLLMAFFKAWKLQKNIGAQNTVKISELRGEIDSLTVSRIDGKIVFAVLGAQPTGSSAGMVVNLDNKGADSAIDPSSWQLTVVVPSGDKHFGSPNTLVDKNLDFCLGPHRALRFVRRDALYLKASEPVKRNGFVQGFLWFAIPTLDRAALVEPTTVISLRADSVSGQKIEFSTTVQTLMDRSKNTSFFPGIENPRPLDIPCQENAPY